MIPGRSVWLYSWEGRGRLEVEGGREGGEVPWGLNRNHTHTHIITHLNSTIVVSKPHNCEFGGAVLPDLKVYMVGPLKPVESIISLPHPPPISPPSHLSVLSSCPASFSTVSLMR